MTKLWSALGAVAALTATVFVATSQAGPRATASADTTGRSTLEQTIRGNNPEEGFSFLRLGPGEPYVVREDLAKAQGGRSARRRSLIYLAQVTDFQLADEESPARVEFVDGDPSSTASSAHRPQEALVAHEVDRSMRQINNFLRSPVAQGDGTRARLANAVMTGDLADNQQRNETEWVLRLLEGGTLDPASGTANFAGTACEGNPVAQAAVPDRDNPRNYTGVQDYDDYALGLGSNLFYDPDEPPSGGDYAGFPKYTGLLNRAQRPFQVEGLEVPSYILFGNHDGLVQGNEDANAAFEEVATGCVKPFQQTVLLGPLPPGSGDDALPPGFASFLNPDALEAVVTNPVANAGKGFLVPPDDRRQFVDKAQFKAIFKTGQEDDHGFAYVDDEELEASSGAASYYSFAPKPGIRYINLDTVSEGGVTPNSSDGNIDDPQFQWLERELEAAKRRNELVVAFGHHATGSLEANIPDELAPPCRAGNDEHGHDRNPGCDRDGRDSRPIHLGDDLAALFHRFPNVIAYVAGHSHENRVAPFKSSSGGDFWEIKSPAIADYPPQHRLIEVMDNRDGTLSIFGTMLDFDSPTSAPTSSNNASVFSDSTLASIGRVLTFNDPQVGPGDFAAPEGGEGADDPEGGPDGTRRDRNVELLIRDPRASTSGGGGGQDDDDGDGAGGDRDDFGGGGRGDDFGGGTGAGDGDGGEDDLPFTGLLLAPLLILGIALLSSGAILRRNFRRS